MKKYSSLSSFKDAVLQLHDKGNDERALRIVHDYVDAILTEPLCTDKALGSKTLDDLCQLIGKSTLKRISPIAKGLKNNKTVLTYIVTKMQKSGGHIKVIEDFINATPQAFHFILLTGIEGKSFTKDFIARFDSKLNILIEFSPSRSYLATLEWLQMRLLEIQADDNYLFNHHQDSVAVAAIQPNMLKKATFYHHGDHHLCLGVYLDHLSHVDSHPMGYHYCRGNLDIENQYIPLVSQDKGRRSDTVRFKKNGYLITATAARSNKVEIPYYVNYLEVIPQLLSETKGRHIHIGDLSILGLLKIRRRLNALGISHDRFVYIPWVPSVWKALQEHNVDLYIASFPYGGAITLIEAMGAGMPVALHKHIYSRVLSCIDMGYRDVFFWETPSDLIDYCMRLTPDELMSLSCLARTQYEKFHDSKVLDELLNNFSDLEPPKNLIDKFEPNSDELMFWTEQQLSFRHLIKRSAHRFMKKIRAQFF